MKFTKQIASAAIVVLALASCSKPSVFTDAVNKIDDKKFEQTVDEKPVKLYTLTGENGIAMKVTNMGARIVALCVPDVNGKPVDVVLGYNNLDDYLNQPENFFGATIGRFGNRICDAKFSIDSVEYTLANNDGKNHLHGGPKGYFDVVWTAEQVSNSKIVFNYLSPDGEEGYPGNLNITMIYELTADNSLRIDYVATTDKPTVCNLTHHTYFNLSGEGAETINDHLLTINASNYTPVDATLIPTGVIEPVSGTPFDFTTATAIGDRLLVDNEQMVFGGGYDHNWVLDRTGEGVELAAKMYSPVTGIVMEVLTDQPGLQFYGGNFLNGSQSGKLGKPYNYRSAVCLETQHFPDSPNQPTFPSTLLLPGQTYNHLCIYKFSVQK